MMLKKCVMLFLLCGLVWLPELRAEYGYRRKKLDSKKYDNHSIIVRQIEPQRSPVGGRLPSGNIAEKNAKRFFEVMDKLPPSFIKRSGLKYVTVLEHLTLNNVPAGGVASGDSIYLSVNFTEKTVYHELFHIFDPTSRDKKWTRLNDKKFVYTGSEFKKESVNSVKRKRRERNLQEGTFDADFVSRYAMSNEKEDRAETFACMVSEGKGFMARCEKSPVLRRKMEFIINLTSKNKLISRDFWSEVLGEDFSGK